MKKQVGFLIALALATIGLVSASPQPTAEINSATLLKRTVQNGVDNYPYATFSFAFGGNGPDLKERCKNNWDIIFGNSPLADAFDVTLVTDDRSRIKDLGAFDWSDQFVVPALPAYDEPTREPSVKAVEGHLYLVHSRDTLSDLHALFRVEKLEPGQSVDITWKIIPPPEAQ